MLLLDRTAATPAEDLAWDDALLDVIDEAPPGHPGLLRIYEPSTPCVVLGYGNRLAEETEPAACAALDMPILRRSSGGGTVLLAPGCLVYALVLPVSLAPELESITGTNRWVMDRLRAAFASLLQSPVAIDGHTDLTLLGRKFSGNAQRRRRRAVLFHGTFLLNLDLSLVERCLALPARRPAYRADRPHRDFLVNLGIPAPMVKQALCQAWNVHSQAPDPPSDRVARLLTERYSRPEWHARF